MENEKDITSRLIAVADALESEVRFEESDDRKLAPVFDIGDITGKLVGLLVYAGIPVPAIISPMYNAVHANVEFWKGKLETKAAEEVKDPPPAPPEATGG